jgi:hypothetical protein
MTSKTLTTHQFKLQTLRGLTAQGPLSDEDARNLAIKYNLSLHTRKRNRLHVFTGHGTKLNAAERALNRLAVASA